MSTDVSEVRAASIITHRPEDSELHIRRRENLKSLKAVFIAYN
jgi:hypothetical protein